MTPNGALSEAPPPEQPAAPAGPPEQQPAGPVEPPLPPRGPGVAPPFAAPPMDRDQKTIWVRIGVSSLILVLGCVAGAVGLGVLMAGAPRQIEAQARVLVDDYLGALVEEEYAEAYRMLCPATTRRTSLEAFTDREQARPISEYEVDDVRTEGDLIVGASVTYQDGQAVDREYVVPVGGTRLRICGER